MLPILGTAERIHLAISPRRWEHFLIPNLVSMGIADIKPLAGIKPSGRPLGYACRMTEKSNGKDTMTGHWEMMGVHTTKPFVTFTDTGFPPELIKLLEEKSGRRSRLQRVQQRYGRS